MIVTLPHADDVDGNLIEAARPLLLCGWSAPAALTARVAIERGLLALVDHHGVSVPERASAGTLADRLYQNRKRKRKPLAPRLDRSVRLYGMLSGIAHGGDVSTFDAVQIIEEVREILDGWRVGTPA